MILKPSAWASSMTSFATFRSCTAPTGAALGHHGPSFPDLTCRVNAPAPSALKPAAASLNSRVSSSVRRSRVCPCTRFSSNHDKNEADVASAAPLVASAPEPDDGTADPSHRVLLLTDLMK